MLSIHLYITTIEQREVNVAAILISIQQRLQQEKGKYLCWTS